jgi:hypothetical protein
MNPRHAAGEETGMPNGVNEKEENETNSLTRPGFMPIMAQVWKRQML